MNKRAIGSNIILATLFAASLSWALTAAAQSVEGATQSFFNAGFKSIVGSWEVVDDASGLIFFGTYNGGPFRGTVNFTSPFSSFSLTHGEWRRTGRRTFVDIDSAFIFDDDGNAVSKITFKAEIKLGADGDTATSDVESETISLEDGSVEDNGNLTATWTRIKVED